MITTSGKHTKKNPHKAAYAHRAHKNLLKDTELFLFSIRFRNLATVKKQGKRKRLSMVFKEQCCQNNDVDITCSWTAAQSHAHTPHRHRVSPLCAHGCAWWGRPAAQTPCDTHGMGIWSAERCTQWEIKIGKFDSLLYTNAKHTCILAGLDSSALAAVLALNFNGDTNFPQIQKTDKMLISFCFDQTHVHLPWTCQLVFNN